MKSQWECLLENVGEWHGSFTHLSPIGEVIADTPTIVSLEGINNNTLMRQVIRHLSPPSEKVLEYASLGRGVLFFENGAFSQGTIQYGPFSEFGAELGFMAGDRRLRLVQLFDKQGALDRLTLIREKLPDSKTPERPPLTLEALIGTWQGEAVTLYPDWRSPDRYPTELAVQRDADQLTMRLVFGGQPLTSIGTITGPRVQFDHGDRSVQVLLLPDGASSTCPLQIKAGQPFFLEVGWLMEPDLRQRMIRRYSDKGEWVSLTLVTERKTQI